MFLPQKILEERLRNLLAEDVGQGDLTTTLVVPQGNTAEAKIIAKERGIIAGVEEARTLLEGLGVNVEALVSDGERVREKTVLMKILGDTRAILSAERTVLNIISRMSGIATTTRNLVERIRRTGLNTRVACTRKVAPGLLYLDKKAVSLGGGDTHRLHLDDMILIKDNHIAVTGGVEKAIERVRKEASFSKKIEVEVTNAKDALKAAKAGVDVIMLDNLSPDQIEKIVKLLKEENLHGKILLEASGGITTENILEYASTMVDIVSLGEITDSAKALDVSLEVTST